MNGSNNSPKKGKLILKIVIPIILLGIIGGIWFVKNNKNESKIVKNVDKVSNKDFELNIKEKIDLKNLKSYGMPIVIDFGSDECIPCKQMAPVLKELNSELQGKAIIRFVDVWKYQTFAQGYPISVIPTQIFIDAKGNPFKPKDADSMKMKLYNSNSGKHTFTVHEGGITKDELLSALKEMGMK